MTIFRSFLLACILLSGSCIGTDPLGFRKVKISRSDMYYTKGKPKEKTRTVRIYRKDCPGCREIIRTKKKLYSDEGKVIYREKVKRQMYKARLIRLKSRSYYDNGKLKEKRFIKKGDGYIKKYDEQGNLVSESRFKDGKPVNPSDTSSLGPGY